VYSVTQILSKKYGNREKEKEKVQNIYLAKIVTTLKIALFGIVPIQTCGLTVIYRKCISQVNISSVQ